MHEKSIELLNKAVADELNAVLQYMYFHFHCDDQGFDLLASMFKKTAIDEMKHIERLSDRILFLKGDVKMSPAHEVKQVKVVRDMIGVARTMEQDSARGSTTNGRRIVAPAQTLSQNNYLSHWSPKKKDITTNSTRNWSTWKNSGITTSPSSLLKGVRSFLADRRIC